MYSEVLMKHGRWCINKYDKQTTSWLQPSVGQETKFNDYFFLQDTTYLQQLHITFLKVNWSRLFCLQEKNPNSAPCQDQDGTGSGVSGYLWLHCPVIKRL